MLCLLANIWDGNTTMTIDVENEKTNKTINNNKKNISPLWMTLLLHYVIKRG